MLKVSTPSFFPKSFCPSFFLHETIRPLQPPPLHSNTLGVGRFWTLPNDFCATWAYITWGLYTNIRGDYIGLLMRFEVSGRGFPFLPKYNYAMRFIKTTRFVVFYLFHKRFTFWAWFSAFFHFKCGKRYFGMRCTVFRTTEI